MWGRPYTHVDVFLPKLFIQALRKRTQREFARRERGRGRVPTQRGGRAGEEQRATLAVLVDGLASERQDSLARERKRRFHVRVHYAIDLVLCDLQERLPDPESRVEERDADVGVRPARTHGAERRLYLFVAVLGYWERRRLCGYIEVCVRWCHHAREVYTHTSVSAVFSSAASLCRASLSREIRATSYPDLAKRRLVCRGGFNAYERRRGY